MLLGQLRSDTLLGTWQKDLEYRAMTRLTVHIDETVVLLDNAVHGGQTQAGSLACFLGGKKRLKDMFKSFPIHTDARIPEVQLNIFPRLCFSMLTAIGAVHKGI